MYTEIYRMSFQDREAELYRAVARRRQVRLAVLANRCRKAEEEHEGRGEGGSDAAPVPRRRGLRRARGAAAAGSC